MTTTVLPTTYLATRNALHAVAEHVCSPARHRVTGRIGLRATPGGFGTPIFGDDDQVRIEGTELVHRVAGTETRASLTTLGAAAAFVGIPLGAPTDVFTPTTPANPDRMLSVDEEGAAALADWFAFAAGLLDRLVEACPEHQPSEVQLWPEHFDLSVDLGEAARETKANFGASPGDATIPEPYLYVGPWEVSRRSGLLGRYPWGGGITYSELHEGPDPVSAAWTFLTTAAEQLLAVPEAIAVSESDE